MADVANLKELTADIVASYVSNNPVPIAEVANLVRTVHAALAEPSTADAEPVQQTPAVPIRKSVTADGITCMFEGETFKMLRRHLLAAHGMTPAEYRHAWRLPPDYPMVSETASRRRSEFAKRIGLGAKVRVRTASVKAAVGSGAKTGTKTRETAERAAGGSPSTGRQAQGGKSSADGKAANANGGGSGVGSGKTNRSGPRKRP